MEQAHDKKARYEKMKNGNFKLCYIDEDKDKAWFTSNFKEQWGDDWDDKPYECNAGEPYNTYSILLEDNKDFLKRKWETHPINLVEIYFETNLCNTYPSNLGSFSVEDINKGLIPWLKFGYDENEQTIFAKTTLNKFVKIIESTGGTIFVKKSKKSKEEKK